MIYSMEPISGALLAYAFLGERWGPSGWLGAAVILLASVATQLQGAVDHEEGSEGGPVALEDEQVFMGEPQLGESEGEGAAPTASQWDGTDV